MTTYVMEHDVGTYNGPQFSLPASLKDIMTIPRISIDFIGENSSSFTIEELTFNPYLKEKIGGMTADIWMEFSIKRKNDGKGIKIVPSVRLASYGTEDIVITTNIPKSISGVEDAGDMNFVMYSDIWYSFVREQDVDYEFMKYGYKSPVRVVSGNNGDPLEFPRPAVTDSWTTGKYGIFRKGKYIAEGVRLRRRVKTFHNLAGAPSGILYKTGISPLDDLSLTYVPNDKLQFSPVNIEFSPNPLKGRFGVRRKPWSESSTNYGVGYGGTADVTQIGQNEFELDPKLFDPITGEKIIASLDSGELIRFWLFFTSSQCLARSDLKRNRIGFSFQIEIKNELEFFNSFIRAPLGFESVTGTISNYKHYAVPPRLFFLWDSYLPEQCYSFSKDILGPNILLELSTAFVDTTVENEKLIKIFVLGVFIGLLGNLAVGSYFSSATVITTLPPTNVVQIPSFISDLFCASMTSLAVVLLTVIAIYKEHKIKLLGVFFTIVSIICAAILHHHGFWMSFIMLILSAPLFLYSFWYSVKLSNCWEFIPIPKLVIKIHKYYLKHKYFQLKAKGVKNVS